jgi:hypothetical protein
MHPETRRFSRFLLTGILGGYRLGSSYRLFLLMGAIVWLLQTGAASAQGGAQKYMKLSRQSLNADNGQIFNVDVQITNNTETLLKPRLTITTDEALDLVTRQEDRPQIAAGKSYFHSAKIRVPLLTRSQEGLRVQFELKDSTGNLLERQEVIVNVNESRNVDFYILEHTMQIKSLNDEVELPIRLHNTGNTDELVSLMAKVPVLPEDRRYITREVMIPAFTDTILRLKQHTTRLGYHLGNFTATVTALYANGDIVGIGTLDVQNLREQKRFRDEQIFPYLQSFNEERVLDVNGQYLFTPYEAYQAVGGSEFYLNKTRVKYNVDALLAKDPNVPTYVRNTYLDIRGKTLGLVLGNINRNFDIVVAGRGVAASINSRNGRSSWETGWVDENHNLVGAVNPFFPTGRAVWLTNNTQREGLNIGNMVMTEENTILAERDWLAGTNILWKTSKHIRLGLGIAGSHSKSTVSDTVKFGSSGMFNIQGRWNRFAFSSENQFSTPYYVGIKRGVSTFNQRISWNSNRFAYGIGASYYQSIPNYVSPDNQSINHTYNGKVELSFGGQISEKIGFIITPNYYHERTRYINATFGDLGAEIESYGAGLQLNYSNLQRKRFVYLYTELGSYHAPLVGKDYQLHAKISGSVKVGWLNLSVYRQWGEFYAGEVSNRVYQRAGYTDLLNVSPFLQHAFFNRKLDIQIGFTYTQSNLSADGVQYNGRIEYTLPNNDKIYTSIRRDHYEEDVVIEMNDLRFGYRKVLPVGHINTGRKNLSVFVYHDVNNNGRFDPQEDSVANDVVVSINKELFVTRGRGMVTYKGLPPGAYSVFVPSVKGWYGAERIVDVNRKTTIEIPLRKNSAVSGRIEYRQTAGYAAYEVAEQKDQLLIRATAENGTVYTTKTAEDGSFIFFIPPGKYSLSVPATEYSDKIECHDCLQSIQVPEGGNVSLVFHFSIRERQIKLQKFVSPNIKKQ